MAEKNIPFQTGFFTALPENRQNLIALIILFAVPFFMYGKVVLDDKDILGSDTIQWYAANHSLQEYSEQHEGKDALWAPNAFSGMPAYVISQPAPVPNIDTLLNKLSDFLYPVVYFWVLLTGVYFFLRLFDIYPLAAVSGAVFIAFTTYIPVIIEAGHVTKFVSFAFIPWVLFGYRILTKSSKKLLGFFIFALALTLEARAAHPQVLYYFLYLIFVWWVYDGYLAYKKQVSKKWIVTSLLLLSGGILAFLSNLENYWSLYEYTQYSTRGGSVLDASSSNGLDPEYAFTWSQGWGELLTLIIPGLFGGGSAEAYWGPKPFTSGPHYLGAIAFVFALIGIFRSKNQYKFVFLGTGMLTAFFSLGKYFPLLNDLMFNFAPLFSKFRTPEMWLIVTVFSFSVLAVFGLNELIQLAKNKNTLKKLYLPLGIAAGLALLFALGSQSLLSFEKPGEIENIARQNNVSADNPQIRRQIQQMVNTRLKPARIEMAKSDSVRFAIFIVIATGLIYALFTKRINPDIFLAGVLILGTYDMLSVGNRYVDDEKLVSDEISPEQYIENQKRPLDEFIIQNIDSPDGYPYRVFPLLNNPFNNAIPTYFYPSIGGYTAAKLSYYQDIIDRVLFAGPYGLNIPVLSMLNTKYITLNQQLSIPQLKKVYESNGNYVYENTSVLPKAFFVDSAVTTGSALEAIQKINPQNNFDPEQFAVVETDKKFSVAADTNRSVEIVKYDVQHIIIDTETGDNAFLVLSEIFYPKGWRATIDGKPTEIYKTNYVLRGIEVPAGNHRIEFIFDPVSNRWGSRISWMGHIMLALTGSLSAVRKFMNKNDTGHS